MFSNFTGFQSHTLVQKLFDGYKKHGEELSESLKMVILLCDHVFKNHGPYHFAKASTIIADTRLKYDRLLEQYDVIIMPTLTNTPCKIPQKESSTLKERLQKSFNMLANTGIFDGTGHPALSLNCGYDREFPVGLMVIGKHFDEVTVLNAASVFENAFKGHL